jgi:hypothetical protein
MKYSVYIPLSFSHTQLNKITIYACLCIENIKAIMIFFLQGQND